MSMFPTCRWLVPGDELIPPNNAPNPGCALTLLWCELLLTSPISHTVYSPPHTYHIYATL